MQELPLLRGRPACPAALQIAGACGSQQGVVCREMERDQQDDPGLNMSAGALERVREGTGGVYLNLQSDPSSLTGFCHGDALPVITADEGQGRASYTYCPTWQAARDRHLAGKRGLYDEPEPESVSMGVPEPAALSVGEAVRELDEVAPRRVEGARAQLAPTRRSSVWA